MLSFTIVGVIVIIGLAAIFHKQLRNVSLRDAAFVLGGVLLAYGTKKATEEVRDLKDKLP